MTDPVPAPSVCGESVNDHNSTGLVFTCSLQKGHEGDHYDINANRGWRAVPAPSVAETLRELAIAGRANPYRVLSDADVEAIEAGARALGKEAEYDADFQKLHDDWQYAEQMLLAISDALDAAAIGYASPEDEELPRVKDALARLKAAEQREAQARAALVIREQDEPNMPAAVYCPICGLKVAGLLAALKEMREAMAATMRVISLHEDSSGIIASMSREFESLGISDGFGVRAQQAIANVVKAGATLDAAPPLNEEGAADE